MASCRPTSVGPCFLMAASVAFAAPAPGERKPVLEVLKLSDTLYELRADDAGCIVKVLASIGPDGVLLVDSGDKRNVGALLETLKRLGGGSPRIVINSHCHQEHWDGNRALGKGPLYVAHENFRQALSRNYFLYLDLDPAILPQVTVKDALTLHFNGEEIRIKSFAGAHGSDDLVVWFTRSRAAFVGALATALTLPTVDSLRGDIRKYPGTTRRLLEYLPKDVAIIPGHGEDATHAQGEAFLAMLERTTDLVKAGIEQGRSLAAMNDEDPLKDWASWEVSYSNRSHWLKALYEGHTGATAAFAAKKTIHEPLYRALKDKGPDGVIPAYDELKARHPGEYRFDERSLRVISSTLQEEGKHLESIPFFKLCLREFPEGGRLASIHEALGDAYLALGQKGLAVEHYRKALEIAPGASGIAAKWRRLEGK